MALRPTIQDVLAGLKTEGHVDAGVDARARTALEIRQKTLGASPWFVKALAGGGAWLSAAFMIRERRGASNGVARTRLPTKGGGARRGEDRAQP